MFITTYFPGKGETAAQFTPQYCSEVLTKAIGEPIDLEIVEAAAWQPYEQVADQFHCGRAFLVGDSGHTMPPFKAGGANTAIQSAHNLAWKLAAVLGGTADMALLDSYHAERHPVGRFAARQSLTGPTVALIDLDDQGPGLPPEEEASMFSLLVGYQYRSAAVVSDQLAPERFRRRVVGRRITRPARYPRPACLGAARRQAGIDARPARSGFHLAHRRRR